MVMHARRSRRLAIFIAVLVILTSLVIAPWLLRAKGKSDAIWVAREVFGGGDHDGSAVTADVAASLRQRSLTYGEVASIRIKEVVVEWFGHPWGVYVEVSRRGRKSLEVLGGNGRRAHSFQVLESQSDQ